MDRLTHLQHMMHGTRYTDNFYRLGDELSCRHTNKDDLLDTLAPASNTDVVPDVTTSVTTSVTTESKYDGVLGGDDDFNNVGQNIPSRIQKDHPSSQIIGDPHGGMPNRQKERVDYRKMIELACKRSAYSQN